MISVKVKEYLKEDIAYSEKAISFLGIPIFKRIDSTTNKNIVSSLKKVNINKIKGFKNEN